MNEKNDMNGEQNIKKSVGDMLCDARIEKDQELTDVASILRIRLPFLEAIENSEYHRLPGTTYAIGFIRGYAEHLGLDSAKLVAQFKVEANELKHRTELHFPEPLVGTRIPGGAIIFICILLAGIFYGAWALIFNNDQSVAKLISKLPNNLAAMFDENEISDATNSDMPNTITTIKTTKEMQVITDKKIIETEATKPIITEEKIVEKEIIKPIITEEKIVEKEIIKPIITEEKIVEKEITKPIITEEKIVEKEIIKPIITEEKIVEKEITKPIITEEKIVETTITKPIITEEKIVEITASETTINEEKIVTTTEIAPLKKIITTDYRKEQTIINNPTVMTEINRRPRVYGIDNINPRVIITANTPTWVEIAAPSGELILTRLLSNKDSFNVPNIKGLLLITGNAGGLNFTVDGVKIPQIGPIGSVRRNISLNVEDLLKTKIDSQNNTQKNSTP